MQEEMVSSTLLKEGYNGTCNPADTAKSVAKPVISIVVIKHPPTVGIDMNPIIVRPQLSRFETVCLLGESIQCKENKQNGNSIFHHLV